MNALRTIGNLTLSALLCLLPTPRLLLAEQTAYEDAASKCDHEIQAKLAKVSDDYAHELNTLMDTFRLRGDLEKTLAVKKEIARFESDKTLEEKNLLDVPVQLHELQKKYLAAPRKAAQEIAKSYVVKLEDAKRKLTIDDKLDEAVSAQQEIDKILKKYGIVNPAKGSELRSGELPKYVAMTVDLKIPTIVDGKMVGYMGLNNGEAYKLVKVDGNQATLRVGNSDVVVPVDSTDLLQQIEQKEKTTGKAVEEVATELGEEPVDDTGNVNILKAFWGAENTWVDVTAKVQAMVVRGESSIDANGGVFGDPTPGHPKTLKITYTMRGQQTTESVGEGASFNVPSQTATPQTAATSRRQKLRVIKATYGAGNNVVDVTPQLQSMVVNNTIRAGRGWDLCHCDPVFGQMKRTVVTYTYEGKTTTKQFGEYESVILP